MGCLPLFPQHCGFHPRFVIVNIRVPGGQDTDFKSNPPAIPMSNSPIDQAATKLSLRFEDAPPFGGGSMPVDQEKSFVMLAHLFSLIIWLWKRKASPAVDAHGKEALNFAITMLIFILPVQIIASILPVLGIILMLIVTVVSLAALALVIIGMIKAAEGKLLRYPVNFRTIK